MSLYQKNLNKFAEKFPLEAMQIVENSEPLVFEQEEIADCDVAIVFGVEKFPNFSGNMFLFEDDLEKIGRLFSQCDIQERVTVMIPSHYTFLQVAWETLFLRIGGDVSQELQKVLDSVHLVASDYADLGHRVLENIEKNAKIPTFDATNLFGKFSGVPAVVCGAGPSLDEALKILPKLENRALIIACGSSLGKVTERGCPAHLFVALDPDPPLEIFLRNTDHAIPIVYQNRLSHKILSMADGRRLRAPGSGGYPADEWIFGEETFDAGWSAGMFGAQLARAMGCSEVFTAGIDGGTGEKDLKLTREDIGKTPKLTLDRFEKMFDIRGKVHRLTLQKKSVDLSRLKEWQKSRKQCQKMLAEWIEKLSRKEMKWNGFYEASLSREPFFARHIAKVFEILRPAVERDIQGEVECALNRAIFYQKVATKNDV